MAAEELDIAMREATTGAERIVEDLRVELAQCRHELASALARLELAERRAVDPAILGRAVLVAQRMAASIIDDARRTAQRIEAGSAASTPAASTATAANHQVELSLPTRWLGGRPDGAVDHSDWFSSLRLALDDGQPLGPAEDAHASPATTGHPALDAAACGGRRPVIRASSARAQTSGAALASANRSSSGT